MIYAQVLSWAAGVWLKLAVWLHAMHACWGWWCILPCCLPITVHPPPPTPDPFSQLRFPSAASRAHLISQVGQGHHGHEHNTSTRARTPLNQLAHSSHYQQTTTACCPVPHSPRGHTSIQPGGLSISLLLATQPGSNPNSSMHQVETSGNTGGWSCTQHWPSPPHTHSLRPTPS